MLPQPSLQALLDSNIAPSPSEAVLIEEALTRLIEEVNTRRTRLRAVEHEIHRHQAVLSPVRRLPPELVGEVFLLLTPTAPNHEERDKLLELTTVCNLWRKAALLTHRLWNGLSIDASIPSGAYDKILFWFKRAGSLPKSLHYKAGSHPCRCGDEYATECCATRPLLIRLLSEGPQLACLDFNLTSLTCLGNAIHSISTHNHVTSIEKRPWDNIQTLRLRFGTSEYRQNWHDPPDMERSILSQLPPVQSFHIELPSSRSALTHTENSRTMTLSSTTEFVRRLVAFTIKWDHAGGRLFDILRNCVNVEDLTIDLGQIPLVNDHRPDRRSLSTTPVLIPKATTLRLRHSSTDILEHLQTPSLTHLDLGLNGDVKEREQCIDVVSDFLLRSGVMNNIRYLRMHYVPVYSVDLRGLFSSLKGLEHLTLDNVDFEGLLFTPPAGTDLPSLRTLDMINIPRHYNIALDLFLLQLRKDHLSCNVTVVYAQSPTTLITEDQWYQSSFSRLLQTRGTPPRIILRVFPTRAMPSSYEDCDSD
ncbi:hypothetical protein DFP72DRAFT_1077900 [Ephemerocybe angulata]|uniref:F-box domain-containing protein n=1 Tax=Ephemerocybe angulata TaxID=980116 RepID=A0A8H6HEL8_9AGAR|nr:hypothetical protein DFP72DRAFT_1077900 [Tulosesus angulatus]